MKVKYDIILGGMVYGEEIETDSISEIAETLKKASADYVIFYFNFDKKMVHISEPEYDED